MPSEFKSLINGFQLVKNFQAWDVSKTNIFKLLLVIYKKE